MNNVIPGSFRIEPGSVIGLGSFSGHGVLGKWRGICTAVLVVNQAEKKQVYTTFPFPHPKVC